ncbi:hypothetical protein [Streptomyces africanus]|uniref:hypothetical protein n=1 Tax=Streptomyces africanus TaxID=231024 RepID=UPI0013028F6D|nr:hypothetical protein [Streptomyces africanus]
MTQFVDAWTTTAYVAAAGGIAALGVVAVYAAIRGTLRPHRARKAAQQAVEDRQFDKCA